MLALEFHPRFITAIREGWKTQALRHHRDEVSPGEVLRLCTPEGQPICPDVRCTDVMQTSVEFDQFGRLDRIMTDGVRVHDLDAFALREGFASVEEMCLTWKQEYGQRMFRGLLVEWTMPQLGARAMPQAKAA